MEEKTIGEKVREFRLLRNLTQDELARKSEIPYTTLTKIETNVITRPTIQTVIKIAKGLEITIDELIN